VRIERDPPSAVITDLVMPGMDGLEFVRRLKEQLNMPVIVFSGREPSRRPSKR
jgi:CheY-like chemotaxis protein